MENKLELINYKETGVVEIWGIAKDEKGVPTTFILTEENELIELPY